MVEVVLDGCRAWHCVFLLERRMELNLKSIEPLNSENVGL